MITAAIVFAGGMALLPPIEPAAPEPAAVAPAPPPPPPPAAPPAGPADAATTVAAADAAASGDVAAAPAAAAAPTAKSAPEPVVDQQPDQQEKTPAAAHEARAARAKPEPKSEPPAAAPATADRKTADKGADKDVAREAWRKNLPDITAEAGKAAILIPIKGSIEGATFRTTTKPHGVLVNLPQAESMITMRFYSIKRDGFRQLWVKQEEGAGTQLRVVLGEASDPQVEIKEDFVRVTVRRPDESPAPAPASPPAAAAATPAN